MKTVHKFELKVLSEQSVRIPASAEVLCVQMQYGAPMLWVRLDTDDAPASRTLFIHGTGHKLKPDAGRYVGTFQLDNGDLVFHVFEARTSP